MNGFRDLFRLLIKNPGMGELRTDVPQPNIRSMSMGNYVIYFRQHAAWVEVIRIMHGDQDKPAIE